ncbi:MAG: hypothetical protein ACE5JN_01275 [Candidatus Methylomirabilia bacterium]
MKRPLKSSLSLLAMTLFLGWGPGVGPAVAGSDNQINIQGQPLPADIANVVNTRFANSDTSGVQFREFTLEPGDAGLFLTPDDQNLLIQIGGTLQGLEGERQVKFRGTVNGQRFEARVKRHDDGTLRARIEGMDVSGMTPEQLVEFASRFDRVRIRGLGGQRYEIKRRADGTLRARFEGMDLSGMTPEQFAQFAVANGFDRLRIRGVDGQRYEIRRHDDGTLRGRIERLNLSERDAKELADSLRAKGLDRVRIRGVDANGNRVRVEYRRDKGLVKNEIERDHRGRDRERHRAERERHRDRDRDDHGGSGRH